MAKGFGDDLWKNVQAVRLGQDGGIEGPARADGDRGLVVGVDAIAATRPAESPRAPGRIRSWARRLRRRP